MEIVIKYFYLYFFKSILLRLAKWGDVVMRMIGYGIWILLLLFELLGLLVVAYDSGNELNPMLLVVTTLIVVTLVVGAIGMLIFRNDKAGNFDRHKR